MSADSLRARMVHALPDRFASKASVTFAGMAHWGGSGPRGHTCRQCSFWRFSGYYADDTGLRDGPCAKWAELSMQRKGPAVPSHAKACKYFEQNKTPPGEHPG